MRAEGGRCRPSKFFSRGLMLDNKETLDYVVLVAREAWLELALFMLKNLAITMPHQVQQVIDNDGWYTSYYVDSGKYEVLN